MLEEKVKCADARPAVLADATFGIDCNLVESHRHLCLYNVADLWLKVSLESSVGYLMTPTGCYWNVFMECAVVLMANNCGC